MQRTPYRPAPPPRSRYVAPAPQVAPRTPLNGTHAAPRTPFIRPVPPPAKGTRHVLLTEDTWPALVYGYCPTVPRDALFPRVVAVKRTGPGIGRESLTVYEASSEIDPLVRNRLAGIEPALAEAVIAAVYAYPDGAAWAKTDWAFR